LLRFFLYLISFFSFFIVVGPGKFLLPSYSSKSLLPNAFLQCSPSSLSPGQIHLFFCHCPRLPPPPYTRRILWNRFLLLSPFRCFLLLWLVPFFPLVTNVSVNFILSPLRKVGNYILSPTGRRMVSVTPLVPCKLFIYSTCFGDFRSLEALPTRRRFSLTFESPSSRATLLSGAEIVLFFDVFPPSEEEVV